MMGVTCEKRQQKAPFYFTQMRAAHLEVRQVIKRTRVHKRLALESRNVRLGG